MPLPPKMPSLWHFATADGTPRNALKVTIVVGTILTLINQGDVILDGEMPSIAKAGLTFVVPYLVATYGAVTAKRTGWRARQKADAGK